MGFSGQPFVLKISLPHNAKVLSSFYVFSVLATHAQSRLSFLRLVEKNSFLFQRAYLRQRFSSFSNQAVFSVSSKLERKSAPPWML
jgi:hypothetical protein